MKKKFQIILSLSMFLILLMGVGGYTTITYGHIYDELVTQVLKDNRVVGETVIRLLKEHKVEGKSADEVAEILQGMCEEILLPNDGFICAIDTDGFLVAAPGIKKGVKVDMNETKLAPVDEEKARILRELRGEEEFQGIATFTQPVHTDIVVMMPVGKAGVRLMVHQNRDAVQTRAVHQVKPLIIIGIIVAMVLGFATFLLVNRLVARYENKLQDLNQELTQSYQELTSVDNQRKEFLHLLSHDLTHPLGSIVTASEALCSMGISGDSKTLDPKLFREHGRLIRSSASHSLGMIHLVREMQDLEARKLNLELKPVDLRNVSDLASKILARKFYEKKINLINTVPDHLPVVAEMYSLCNTVLTNLLSNAVKFSHRGSSVEVSAARDGETVKLSVSDSGIGMSPDVLSGLFDITPGTLRPGTEGETGTGFGMPMIKRLVEVYGGSITVDSRELSDDCDQCGTVVTIYLKAHVKAAG
ncbi:MAG: HAMP domain-containing histidine kinase [bacterium]|nr:HAMP domain-containing histidine kinase [bacterium]